MQIHYAPLNLEPRHPRLRVNIPCQQIETDLCRRVLPQLLALVLRVLVVAHPHELLLVVRPGEDERCNT